MPSALPAETPVSPRVLLVEDHDDSREMYAQGLRQAGFQVEAVNGPIAALAIRPALRFDVVVVDYAMPQMSGAELAVYLKERDATSAARFVLVTGQGREALQDAAATVHFDAMVKKPVASD